MSTSRRGFLKGMGKGLLATALATATQSKAISKLIDEHPEVPEPKTVKNLLESPGGVEPRNTYRFPEAEPVITEEMVEVFNENLHKHFDISSQFPATVKITHELDPNSWDRPSGYEPAKKPEIEFYGDYPELLDREHLNKFLAGPELSNEPHQGIIPVAGIGDKRYAYCAVTGQVYKGDSHQRQFSWKRMWGIDYPTFFKETGLITDCSIFRLEFRVCKYTGTISDTE